MSNEGLFLKGRKAFFKSACNSVHDIGSIDCNVCQTKGIFPKVMIFLFFSNVQFSVLQELKVKSLCKFLNLFHLSNATALSRSRIRRDDFRVQMEKRKLIIDS